MNDYRTRDEVDLIRQCRIALGAQLLGSEVTSETDADRIAKNACHRGHTLAYAILAAEHADRMRMNCCAASTSEVRNE